MLSLGCQYPTPTPYVGCGVKGRHLQGQNNGSWGILEKQNAVMIENDAR